jgi:hypothetical protein
MCWCVKTCGRPGGGERPRAGEVCPRRDAIDVLGSGRGTVRIAAGDPTVGRLYLDADADPTTFERVSSSWSAGPGSMSGARHWHGLAVVFGSGRRGHVLDEKPDSG